MREDKLISNILSNFKRSEKQKNKPFECDAEIVTIANQLWGITMDEFSADEDSFYDLLPYKIGRNVAVAVLSDLFACGAKPSFFMQSLVVSEACDVDFVDDLTKGISDVLDSVDCYLLGGDIGRASDWRYTGVALGAVCSGKYISRKMPITEQALWVTGKLGDANLAAFTQNAAPEYELRFEEAEFIRNNATSCIDTSGGFVDSLWVLKTLNQDLCFEIDSASLPIDEQIIEFCRDNDLPAQAFLFGGAGEYELLFTTPIDVVPHIEATKIGIVHPSAKQGLFFNTNGHVSEIMQPVPCPREINDRSQYIQAILEQVNYVFR